MPVILLILLTLFAPIETLAQGGGSGGRFEVALSSTNFGFSTSSKQIEFGPGFWFAIFQWLQIGGDASYQEMAYRGGNTYNWTFMVGPNFNIGPNLADAVFFTAGGGFRVGGSDFEDPARADPDGFAFYFMAGKRFALGHGFSLRPSVGMFSAGTTAFLIRPLSVSFNF